MNQKWNNERKILKEEIKKLRTDYEDKEKKFENMKQKWKNEKKILKTEIEELMSDNEKKKCNEKVQNHEKEKDMLKEEIEKIKRENEDLRQKYNEKVKNHEQDTALLKKEIKQLRKENENLTKKFLEIKNLVMTVSTENYSHDDDGDNEEEEDDDESLGQRLQAVPSEEIGEELEEESIRESESIAQSMDLHTDLDISTEQDLDDRMDLHTDLDISTEQDLDDHGMDILYYNRSDQELKSDDQSESDEDKSLYQSSDEDNSKDDDSDPDWDKSKTKRKKSYLPFRGRKNKKSMHNPRPLTDEELETYRYTVNELNELFKEISSMPGPKVSKELFKRVTGQFIGEAPIKEFDWKGARFSNRAKDELRKLFALGQINAGENILIKDKHLSNDYPIKKAKKPQPILSSRRRTGSPSQVQGNIKLNKSVS